MGAGRAEDRGHAVGHAASGHGRRPAAGAAAAALCAAARGGCLDIGLTTTDPRCRVELYIYYRIAEADAQAFAAELDDLVPRLAARCPGLRSRWLRRPESRDGMLTIMEIHHHPDGLPEAMVMLSSCSDVLLATLSTLPSLACNLIRN